MQVLHGGSFTDKKRVSEYLNMAGFEDISIRLIPNTMKSLYLITAKKAIWEYDQFNKNQYILSNFDKEFRKLTKNKYFNLLDKFWFIEWIK